jgi:2,4-dienoyl-CoA reductase-like NADH-dependent reductase (Old Yellow Enzyme family)/thioredoxin reductase
MFASDDRDNIPGDTLAVYCAERAKGGVGLIEVSMGVVGFRPDESVTGNHFDHLMGGRPMNLSGRWPIHARNPRVVIGYSKLAKAVHEYGGKCAIELTSRGNNLSNDKGVSPFPWPSHPIQVHPYTGREMDENDIENDVAAYGEAAKLVKQSGLDAVDIYGSHGTMIAEFLSGVMNRRKDRWGGPIENRARFLLEVIKRVRENVGTDLSIGMRLMGDERFEGGNTPKEATEIARMIDGKVDWVTPDQGNTPQQEGWQAVPMYMESGYNLRITSPVKQVLKKTKLGIVGKYVDPLYAENLLANGVADMVAMTRALIADPELPNKAMQGLLQEIRPCIGVLQECWGRMILGIPISCTVNPAVSREKEWGIGTLKQAERKKKVLIIGAGPAGLETARIAALRGHTVVVYEKSRQVGGQAILAGKLPGRQNIRAIITWLNQEVKKLDVEIKLGLEVTAEEDVIDFVINDEKPDAVVIATGSVPIRTGYQSLTFNDVKGHEQEIVCTDQDIWEERVKTGNRIIIGDTLSFIEAPGLAEYLGRLSKEVEVVTPLANIGLELTLYNHWEHVFPRVFGAGVKISPFTWIKNIDGHSVTLYNVFENKIQRIVDDVDNVVLITGRYQNDRLFKAFSGKVSELYLAGDANIAGARIGNAMYDAQKIGRAM